MLTSLLAHRCPQSPTWCLSCAAVPSSALAAGTCCNNCLELLLSVCLQPTISKLINNNLSIHTERVLRLAQIFLPCILLQTHQSQPNGYWTPSDKVPALSRQKLVRQEWSKRLCCTERGASRAAGVGGGSRGAASAGERRALLRQFCCFHGALLLPGGLSWHCKNESQGASCEEKLCYVSFVPLVVFKTALQIKAFPCPPNLSLLSRC